LKFVEDFLAKAKARFSEFFKIHAPVQFRRDAEVEFLRNMPDIPYSEHDESGVLLADKILHFATGYRMIDPFDKSKLKPAAYELSVGALYSIAGKTHTLKRDTPENEIIIQPFEVVIIQTLERLNLPEFLIARWNVRVRWAYRGLLWVGAAQVDPGFKGFLACPLYNLSNEPVRLHYGDEIAVIDFVTTTSPNVTSRAYRYKPANRTRILFEDYAPNELQSALATEAKDKLDLVERSVSELKSRVDASVAVITTAIGIVVGALALFASRQMPDVVTYWSPSVMIGTLAFIAAILGYVHSLYRHLIEGKRARKFVLLELLVLALLITLVVLLLRIGLPGEQFRPRPTHPDTSGQHWRPPI
jgi:deoxycytidine triphosphate deaminase